jgi:hypothetical protein
VYDYLGGQHGALVIDSFKAHFVEEVVDYMEDINVPGSTGIAQPLDVSVNKPFKGYMTEEWNNWMDEPTTEADFTKSGNRKRPSYEKILKWVSASVNRISQNRELIKKV